MPFEKIIVYFHAVLGSIGTKDGRRRKNVFHWMLTKIHIMQKFCVFFYYIYVLLLYINVFYI
jgi:hypothetical protein